MDCRAQTREKIWTFGAIAWIGIFLLTGLAILGFPLPESSELRKSGLIFIALACLPAVCYPLYWIWQKILRCWNSCVSHYVPISGPSTSRGYY